MKRLFWWWRSRKNIAARLVPQLTLIYENVSDVIYYLTVTQGHGESANGRMERMKENSQIHLSFGFLYVNASFYRTTRIDYDVVGKKIEEVIPESSHELVLGNYRKAINTRETVKWIETSPYPAGLKYGEVSITPIIQNGISLLFGTVRDVTEIHELRQEVQRLRGIIDGRSL